MTAAMNAAATTDTDGTRKSIQNVSTIVIQKENAVLVLVKILELHSNVNVPPALDITRNKIHVSILTNVK